jgi:hypothetical protein
MTQTATLVGVAIVLFVAFAFDVYCLRDLRDAPVVYAFSREMWASIIIFTTPLGGMAYLTIGRPR